MFPQADLVISHGGHGTVIAALAAGVPVLCLPMGRDQGDVAARVVWHSAGLRLLGEPRFRDGARRLARALAEEDGARGAVGELEALAGAARTAPAPLSAR